MDEQQIKQLRIQQSRDQFKCSLREVLLESVKNHAMTWTELNISVGCNAGYSIASTNRPFPVQSLLLDIASIMDEFKRDGEIVELDGYYYLPNSN